MATQAHRALPRGRLAERVLRELEGAEPDEAREAHTYSQKQSSRRWEARGKNALASCTVVFRVLY